VEAYGGRPDGRTPKGDVMLNLTTVMLGSEDAQALSAFYTKVLGEPSWQDGGYVGWQVGDAMLMIGPHSEVKGRNETPGRIMINFETSDVQGEFERIKGLGARVEKEPYAPSDDAEMRMATFEDPDGNFFQLLSPMPAQ
jgi:predicted enzyme related to lactoylglutathione lyase